MALLWAGVLAGPIGWAADFMTSYAIVKWACGGQHLAVLRMMPLMALGFCAAGALASGFALHQSSNPAAGSSTLATTERGRFMAVLGLWMSALFTFVVLVNVVPRWVLDACL
jgi:hypothetical protein